MNPAGGICGQHIGIEFVGRRGIAPEGHDRGVNPVPVLRDQIDRFAALQRTQRGRIHAASEPQARAAFAHNAGKIQIFDRRKQQRGVLRGGILIDDPAGAHAFLDFVPPLHAPYRVVSTIRSSIANAHGIAGDQRRDDLRIQILARANGDRLVRRIADQIRSAVQPLRFKRILRWLHDASAILQHGQLRRFGCGGRFRQSGCCDDRRRGDAIGLRS